MRTVIYILLISGFIACSNHPVPKGILEPAKMENVVYDLLKVDEYLSNFFKDTTVNIKLKRSILYEQVFKLNSTNRKEFYTSYRYYQQHPDIQKSLFDSISARSGRSKTPVPHLPAVQSLKAK